MRPPAGVEEDLGGGFALHTQERGKIDMRAARGAHLEAGADQFLFAAGTMVYLRPLGRQVVLLALSRRRVNPGRDVRKASRGP